MPNGFLPLTRQELIQDGITQPTASISELQQIPQGQALIFQGRKKPYLTELDPIWAYPETAPAARAVYPTRKIDINEKKRNIAMDCIKN